MGKLVVLYGPSTGGKTTIATSLGIEKVPTATTRKQRDGEVDGIDYHFKTKQEFIQMLEGGELAEHSEYVGNLYGCPKASLEEVFNGNESKVVTLNIEGVKFIKENYKDKDVKFLFIGAYIDSIERRLKERNLSEEELKARLDKAEINELSHKYRQYADEIIWNNDGMDIEDVINHIKKLLKMWGY